MYAEATAKTVITPVLTISRTEPGDVATAAIEVFSVLSPPTDTFPTTLQEAGRLVALRQYGILDTLPEAAFDDIVRLAAQICRVPIAQIVFVDELRQWAKASFGWEGGRDLPRDLSFGTHVIGQRDLFIVLNASEDSRFARNPFVTGPPHLRFCAAMPLTTDDNEVVGALITHDDGPRFLDDKQAFALRALARQVMSLLGLRRRIHELSGAIAVRSSSEEKARWQARHDILTGLPNRALFVERVDEALRAARLREDKGASPPSQPAISLSGNPAPVPKKRRSRSQRGCAVLFVDLDRFKRINDTLGHAAGDTLLREVASRFSGCLRPEDTLARMGGDEFTVLLPDIPGPSYAASVSQMLLRTLRRPVVLGKEELQVGASIGIALSPRDGVDAQTLLKHADIAMYEAKASGGYQSYSRKMNSSGYQQLIEEGELRRAIERGELSVAYQPQMDMATGHIQGVEALARWRHPERGMVPPSHFIAIAEQADLIVLLGEFILRQACRDCAGWRAEGHTDVRVAVNLSARQLAQPRLLETIQEILRESDLPGEALDIELTETALCANGDATPQTLQALRALGVRVFVDDFGTGYSSLAYLRRFAVDMLKVDRSFVAGLGKNTPDDALVRALIEMAHALDLKVVAEGVETEGQLAKLRALNCDIVQGYLLSRPIPLDSLRALLISNRRAR